MKPRHRSQWATAASVVAVLFGLVTLFAGGRVLMGADPGYVVHLPLLRFNTAMGLVYVAVGLLAWWRPRWGLYGAAAVFLLNLTALVTVSRFQSVVGTVAAESVQAMTLRTVVWLVLVLVLGWVARRPSR